MILDNPSNNHNLFQFIQHSNLSKCPWYQFLQCPHLCSINNDSQEWKAKIDVMEDGLIEKWVEVEKDHLEEEDVKSMSKK